MNKVFYKMQLDDPAMPSFCSFSKDYFGSLQDFKEMIDGMREKGICLETVQAFERYLEGDSCAEHIVCYNKTPILVPARMISIERFNLEETEWDHENTYGCIYKMRADCVAVEQVLFECEDYYYRCVRPIFGGLQYKGEHSSQWLNVGNRLWGNESVVRIDGKVYAFRLFVVEQRSQNLDDILGSMWNQEKLDFRKACDEIFGNG